MQKIICDANLQPDNKSIQRPAMKKGQHRIAAALPNTAAFAVGNEFSVFPISKGNNKRRQINQKSRKNENQETFLDVVSFNFSQDNIPLSFAMQRYSGQS